VAAVAKAAPVVSEPVLVPKPIPNAPLPPQWFYQRYYGKAVEQAEVPEERVEPKLVTKPASPLFSWRWSLAVPAVAVSLLFVGFTGSYFGDLEVSLGNILQAASTYSQLDDTPDLTAQTLVINEVMADTSCSVGNTEAQWIELYNGSGSPVNLKNFKITDGTNTIDLVNANNLVVAPDELALLAHNSGIWQQCGDSHGVVTGNLGGTLDIDTGELQLLDRNGVVLDTVRWGTASGIEPTQDQSIERLPTGWDSASGTNFTAGDFMVMDPPSPGL
jgi:hypothetical protein